MIVCIAKVRAIGPGVRGTNPGQCAAGPVGQLWASVPTWREAACPRRREVGNRPAGGFWPLARRVCPGFAFRGAVVAAVRCATPLGGIVDVGVALLKRAMRSPR